jgi:[citrate (pro-3S)-lyase] ligase
LKEQAAKEQIHCLLDVEIFCRYYAPRFGIRRRYVGTEPLSPMTDQYNRALLETLPEKGIQVRQIPRLAQNDTPVSASAVRAAMAAGDQDALRRLVPETTYQYLTKEATL